MSWVFGLAVGLCFWAVFLIGFIAGALWGGRPRDEMDEVSAKPIHLNAECRGR